MDAQERQAWRGRYPDRVFDPPELSDPQVESLYDRLRDDGIAMGRFEELFGSRELFEQARARALADASPLPESLPADDPLLRIALDPRLLLVVNSYLGLRAMLRSLEVWRASDTARPTDWRRDEDDLMSVRLIVHLTDVGHESALLYGPGTHPVGTRSERPADDDPEHLLVCTGEAGTVLLADTCGWHRLPPAGDEERVLLMAQYTSAAARSSSAPVVHGEAPWLNADQLAALSVE